MEAHFDDLHACYFSERSNDMFFPSKDGAAAAATSTSAASPDPTSLDTFSRCLSRFTRYNSIAPLAALSYTSDLFGSASIVSSLEFDADQQHLAVAGVTRRIKIYDYSVILRDAVDVHYPSAG